MNVTVAAGLVAAIGDIGRFSSPQKLVSYFGLDPRVRQSGLGLAQHGRISKIGRAHGRVLLVEAAWAAAKAPGPLHSFFLRIRAGRPPGRRRRDGTQDGGPRQAACARAAGRQADAKGQPAWARLAYNIKALRNQELAIAAQAERAYEHRG